MAAESEIIATIFKTDNVKGDISHLCAIFCSHALVPRNQPLSS